MKTKEKTILKKFLKDNNITFKGEGSALNSDCVVFAGFALYVSNNDGFWMDELCSIISDLSGHNKDFEEEFRRVFNYAHIADYCEWWKLPVAKAKFKF